jgi:hypothetical protein
MALLTGSVRADETWLGSLSSERVQLASARAAAGQGVKDTVRKTSAQKHGWLQLAAAEPGKTPAARAGAPAPGAEGDLGETALQMSNPVGSLWQLVFQNDLTMNEDSHGRKRWSDSLKFQPVMPFLLTQQWKLITRPVIPINLQSEVNGGPPHGWDHESGLGDIVLMTLLSPNVKSRWVWGFGPTWMFPTATQSSLGSEKWSVGPAATVFYLGDKWIIGGVWQNWFSFCGDGDRDDVSRMDFQYIIKYRVTPTFSVGMSPNIANDWSSSDGWSVPVGLGVDYTFKIGKMPFKIFAEAQYYVTQPDGFGPEWNFRVGITPVIPAPGWAQKPLFGGR